MNNAWIRHTGPPHYLAALGVLVALLIGGWMYTLGGLSYDQGLTLFIAVMVLDALFFRCYRWWVGYRSEQAIFASNRNGAALHLARSLQRTSRLRALAKTIWFLVMVAIFLRLEVVRVGGVGSDALDPGNLGATSIMGVGWLDDFIVDWYGNILRYGLLAMAALFVLADVVEDIDYRHLFGLTDGELVPNGIHAPSALVMHLEEQLMEARAEIAQLKAREGSS